MAGDAIGEEVTLNALSRAEDLAGTPIAVAVDGMLSRRGDGANALVSLHGIGDAAKSRAPCTPTAPPCST